MATRTSAGARSPNPGSISLSSLAVPTLEGKIELVELGGLQVDSTYQRELRANYKRIVKEFKPQAAGVLTVARRHDGSLWIIDGLQRATAMKKLGVEKWRALVLRSSGPEYEAQVFQLLNSSKSRKQLDAYELFKAALIAKDPVAVELQDVVRGAGLELKRNRKGSAKWPYLQGVGSLYHRVGRYGGELVGRALALMEETWPGQDDCMRDPIPLAMIQLLASQENSLDQEYFSTTLGQIKPRKILLDAAPASIGGQGRVLGAANSIVSLYNKKRRATEKLAFLGTETKAQILSSHERLSQDN